MRLLHGLVLLAAALSFAAPARAQSNCGPNYASLGGSFDNLTYDLPGGNRTAYGLRFNSGAYGHNHGSTITWAIQVCNSGGGGCAQVAAATLTGSENNWNFGGSNITFTPRTVGRIVITSSIAQGQSFHSVDNVTVLDDTDCDTVTDPNDNCPNNANPGQEDNEPDGIGDVCDSDDDNDGVSDPSDNCQFVANSTQDDEDGDGIGDVCDTCTDPDGDNFGDYGFDISGCTLGSTTEYDNCPDNPNPSQSNIDEAFDDLVDGVYPGDACDTCTDSDGDDYGDFGYTITGCVDGSITEYDNCPNIDNSQINTDEAHDSLVGGVLQGDACDPCTDSDDDDWGDGGTNSAGETLMYSGCPHDSAIDNCTTAPNESQLNADPSQDIDVQSMLLGDACDPCTDSDEDGYGDGGTNGDGDPLQILCSMSTTEIDNCTSVPNPGQVNTDPAQDAAVEGAISGDACDTCTDSDQDEWGDGGTNGDGETLEFSGCAESSAADNCPATANPGQINTDPAQDALGDACDTCTDQDDDTWGDGGTNADGETLQMTTCADDTIVDNCIDVPNTNQGDWDSDLIGDVCDTCTDFDDDGFGDPAFDISGCDGTDDVNCEGAGDPDCDPFYDNCPDATNVDQSDLDSDGDGDVCDECTDPDVDGYGTPGLALSGCSGSAVDADNCPDDTNSDQADADVDLVGDVCDTCTDIDDDGYGDPGFPDNTCTEDNCPSTSNADQADLDSDGTGDACDTCTDGDGDGYGDPGFGIGDCTGSDTIPDNCPNVSNADQIDTDLDGQGDACDLDDDDDTHLDADEIAVSMNPLDQDSDGDNIADWDETSDATNPEDTDDDSVIDSLDDDSDGDGILDIDEAGDTDLGTVPVDTDDDGTPDFRDVDSDDDGVEDGEDNCRTVSNEDQLDTDGDGIGNDCEDDSDGDEVLDVDDNCPLIANVDQVDFDDNGTGDACEGSKPYISGPGCGCGGGAPAPVWLLALLPLLARRRTLDARVHEG